MQRTFLATFSAQYKCHYKELSRFGTLWQQQQQQQQQQKDLKRCDVLCKKTPTCHVDFLTISILIKHEYCLYVCLFVRVFQSHQKSQGHEIWALSLIWANVKHHETFSKFWFLKWSPHMAQCYKNMFFFIVFFLRKSQSFQHIGLWNFDKVDILDKGCVKKILKIHIFRGVALIKNHFAKKRIAHVSDKNKTFVILFFLFFYIPAKNKSARFRPRQTKNVIEVLTFFSLGSLTFHAGHFIDPAKCQCPFVTTGTARSTCL